MGVDISTWRCRVGMFTQDHGPGVMIINFSTLMKIIGCFTFIKMLLIMSGIEQNPGPATAYPQQQAPPTINVIVTMSLGKPWELNMPFSGDGPFTIKVKKDGTELTGNDHIEISYTAECVTVKVNKLIMDDSGTYHIDVSNDVGTVTYTIEMKVVAPPIIIMKVEDQAVSLGEPWELNLPISGDGPFTIKVMKDGTELTRNDHIEISYTAECVTVKVNKLTMDDSGSYRIDVSNDNGTVTCTFEMKVGGKYNFTYQYLLVEIGTKVLRNVFDCVVGNDFGQYLNANPTESNKLTSLMTGNKRKITADQEKFLPPFNTKPVSSDFDISLLTCLLRNVCGLRHKNHLVWVKPIPGDTSIEATITRLKHCRNNLSHSGTVMIPEKSLNNEWTELSDILSELNKHCGKNSITNLPAVICEAKQMDFDEEKHTRFNKIVNMWCENDPDLREFKAKMTEMAIGQDAFKKVLDTVGEDIHDMKSEFIQFKAVLTLIAAKQEAAEAGQMLLYNGAQKCVSVGVEKTSIGVDDDVSRTMENMLSQIKEEDIDIVGVEKGSVILSLRCYSITALKNIYKYFADKQYNERLTELENTLSERLNCSVELNFSIVPETLYTALAQKDEATHRKSIVLTLQCRGAEGVRHAYKCLVNGSSTNAMNEVSEALSKAVGQDIELRTTIEDWNVRLLENDTFVFRYQYLLVNIGTKVLRELFVVMAGNDISKYLTSKSKDIQQLTATRLITPAQKQMLLSINNQPDIADFDITLLSCLLRNICGVCPPTDQAWMTPAPTDTCTEADIARLRMCRNELMHSDKLRLPDSELKVKWNELSMILTRLNQKAGIAQLQKLIDDAEHMDVDEDLRNEYNETIKEWEERDKIMDHGIEELKHELSGVKRKVEDIALTVTQQQIKRQRVVELTDIQRDIIENYKCHFKTLPVSPVTENVDNDLLHVYQSPTLYSVDHTEKNFKLINSYEDIFSKDSKICKFIYITGDTGVGKTSFCRRLCLLWCMAKCSVAVGDEALKKDVDYISKFDFVFYITLRETRRTHVLDMIRDQFRDSDDEKYEPKQIKSVLRDKQCLVLLDGMDEWSPGNVGVKKYKTPEKVYSENCVYLTTCRPYRIESVRLSHKKDIDHQIQMTGISGRSSERYVQKLVDYMNRQEKCNRKSSDFEKEVEKCGLNKQLCIPIITSHLVVLWYERPLTGMPSAVIYGNILEMLFKRAEKREIQFPPSTPSTHQLPNSLTGLRHLNKYVSFIYKVCNLSFCSMFKQDENETSLVFTRDQLESEPYCFSIEETDFLCKIGILSKNEVFGFYSEEKLKISFIHKTYLEFFAALFLTSFDQSDSFNEVTKRWKCLDQVLPCENLLLLLAGFSYEGIKQFFDNIYLQLSDDLTSIRRNAIFHYDEDSYKNQMKSLQNIVANCFNEFSRSKEMVLKIEDFIFDDDSNVDILRQLLFINSKCVKSIHSVNGKYYPEFDQIHYLQYLDIKRVSSADIVKFTQCMLQNKSTLHTVCIEGGYIDEPLIPELLVRSLHHLTSLSLSKVEIQHNSLHYLVKFLSDNVLIENIKLSFVSCVNHQYDDSDCTLTLNLPQHTKLTSLYLLNVNILCNNVNNSSLQSVTLDPLSERIVRLCYSDLFKCLNYSQLEHLDIDDYLGYMSDNKTMKTLTSTVKSLPCLKLLRLWFMKLTDVLLQLHPQVTQVKIELGHVTMSRQWFHCFVESCVNNSEIKVVLICCKIRSVDGETHSVLSHRKSVKYMSEHLESISTINITYKGRGYDRRLDFETRSCQ